MYKRQAPLVLFALLGSVSVMGASPGANPHAPPPPPMPVIGERVDDATAGSIFAQTMVKMREIDVEPFLRYNYWLRLSERSRTASFRYAVIERLRDHLGRFVAMNVDGTYGRDAAVRRALISPALFLDTVRGDDGLQTYGVKSDGVETSGDCLSDIKIVLVPKAHPKAHVLRELWVDRVTDEICRADVLQTIAPVHAAPTLVALKLNASGFVERWSDALAARGEFSAIDKIADADPKLFR